MKLTENDSYDFRTRIPTGFSRSRVISHLVRELDEFLASGPTATLPDSGSEEHEDIDVRADTGIERGADEGSSDSDAGRPSDQGSVPTPTLGDGTDTDEGPGRPAADTQIEAVRSDVESTSDERVQPPMEEGPAEQRRIEFSYPAHLSGGGTEFN